MGSPLVYELRVYSLEAGSFGQVLRARRIRAAHCLTSVQFSPTSQLLLLSYGRCVVPSNDDRAGLSFGLVRCVGATSS